MEASGEALQQIIGSVKRVTDFVSEIAAASREQSTGINQVNKAVTQMDQVTQTNAAQTEELSGTAEELATQGKRLLTVVAQFHIADNGARQSEYADHKRSRRAHPATRLGPSRLGAAVHGSRHGPIPDDGGDNSSIVPVHVHGKLGNNGAGSLNSESELDSAFEEM